MTVILKDELPTELEECIADVNEDGALDILVRIIMLNITVTCLRVLQDSIYACIVFQGGIEKVRILIQILRLIQFFSFSIIQDIVDLVELVIG